MIYDRFENLDLYAQSGTRLHWALTYAHDTHRPGCHLRENKADPEDRGESRCRMNRGRGAE
jgi:hypothetical protein